MTDPQLDEHYEAATRAGAIGGKLMGAGGGGFFMFYVRPADRRRVMDVPDRLREVLGEREFNKLLGEEE